jgi:hypothetical protein
MCHLKNEILRRLRNAALKRLLSGGGEKQIRKRYLIDGPPRWDEAERPIP